MFIRTERLFLRPTWEDDLDEFVALLNDEAVARNIGTKALPETAEAAREAIGQIRSPLLPHFFINLRTEDGLKLIGGIGLGRDGDDVELGYWIGRAYWGQGYASEAVKAVLGNAWMLGHERIVARHVADSEANASVLTKAGFRSTGEIGTRYSEARGGDIEVMTFVAERPAMPDFADNASESVAASDVPA
jgi:[ribosomal protein S5]-alanine N-acetyltransferase